MKTTTNHEWKEQKMWLLQKMTQAIKLINAALT